MFSVNVFVSCSNTKPKICLHGAVGSGDTDASVSCKREDRRASRDVLQCSFTYRVHF